jgi:hypothetical protein
VVPVLVVIVVALVGLYYTGAQDLARASGTLRDVIGAADPFASLLWASFAGVVVAMGMAIVQRILTRGAGGRRVGGRDARDAAGDGDPGAGMVAQRPHRGAGDRRLPGRRAAGRAAAGAAAPLVFLIAAATAFATGTAWGTMAILFPVVVPLAVNMGAGVGFAGGENYTILLGAISSIMAGAVFGDHASPISDTTVISSMASGCDHIDHVRTRSGAWKRWCRRACAHPRAALGQRAQGGGVLVQLRLRHQGAHRCWFRPLRLDPEDLPAPLVQVADHVAQEVVGGVDLHLQHRLQEHRIGLLRRLLEGHRSRRS